MMPFDLSTGNMGAAVSFPLDEGKWVPMPFAPWSTVNGFYRKTLWVQKPDSSPQDVFNKPGFALLKMVEFEKSDATTLYSFSFNNILEDHWIVGPKKNGVGGILGMTPSELYDKRYDFIFFSSASSSSNSDDSELKRKLKEAEEALEEQKKKAQDLQANLDTKEQELTSTSEALAAQKRTHQTYISRKASEVKKLKQTHDESENKLIAEKEKLAAEVEATSRRLSCTLASTTSGSGPTAPTFYGFIQGIVTDMHKALEKKVDDINTKAQKYTTSTPTAVTNKNPDEIIAFMFQDQHNQWTRVDDDVFQLLIVAYEKNCQDTVKYTAYGNSYETKLIIYANSQNQFEQVNVATTVRRVLTAVARKDEAQLLPGSTSTTPSTSNNDSSPRNEFIRKSMDTLLFGDSHFTVNLESEMQMLKTMLIGSIKPVSATLNHTFAETTDPFILKLSELVQLHSSMASGFKYLSPDGDKSKSALIIQPEVISKAFKKATEENYSNIRLVFHGSSDYTPWLTTSFSFNHSGKNGSALGQGFYMAMSDEVAAEYGMRYPRHGFPKGNMMACLSFTPKSPTRFSSMKKKIDHHQNYNDGRYDANIASRYIDVGGAIKHLEHHNALGFNDPTLVVPIGVMVPYS
jgi:hypothetical protein